LCLSPISALLLCISSASTGSAISLCPCPLCSQLVLITTVSVLLLCHYLYLDQFLTFKYLELSLPYRRACSAVSTATLSASIFRMLPVSSSRGMPPSTYLLVHHSCLHARPVSRVECPVQTSNKDT
jgi:hypothetical protein